MKTQIITELELEDMKQQVLEQLKFAKSVQANTKQLEKQYMILTLALVGLHVEL